MEIKIIKTMLQGQSGGFATKSLVPVGFFTDEDAKFT